jgi:hypothetical protein
MLQQAQNREDIIVRPMNVNGQTKWELEIVSSKKKGTFGNYPVLGIPYKQPATLVAIKIENPQGSTWKFSGDPFWVKWGPPDPTSPSSVPTEIPPGSIQVLQQGTQLQFVDKNKKAGDLHYTLNFVNASNQTSSSLDPIIQNGGGGEGMVGEGGLDWASYLILGAVAGALITIAIVRWGLGWRSVK